MTRTQKLAFAGMALVLVADIARNFFPYTHVVHAAPGHKYAMVFVNAEWKKNSDGIFGCVLGDEELRDLNNSAAQGWESVSMTQRETNGCDQFTVLMRR